MTNLALVRSESFGTIQCDFWTNDDGNIFMTSKQLGQALGYADPQKGIDNILSRNDYLKQPEFSVTLKMRGADEKQYDTRLFTEDGIYEVTFLASTDKAREFRNWVRGILKSLRTGEATIITKQNKQIAPLAALQHIVAVLTEQDRVQREQAERQKQLEERTENVERTLTVVKETLANVDPDWRKYINEQLNKIVNKVGGKKYQEIKTESYKILEERAHCDLNARLRNLRQRLENAGVKRSTINNACKLDVIEREPRLKEIYTTIIKEMVIRYLA